MHKVPIQAGKGLKDKESVRGEREEWSARSESDDTHNNHSIPSGSCKVLNQLCCNPQQSSRDRGRMACHFTRANYRFPYDYSFGITGISDVLAGDAWFAPYVYISSCLVLP